MYLLVVQLQAEEQPKGKLAPALGNLVQGVTANAESMRRGPFPVLAVQLACQRDELDRLRR